MTRIDRAAALRLKDRLRLLARIDPFFSRFGQARLVGAWLLLPFPLAPYCRPAPEKRPGRETSPDRLAPFIGARVAVAKGLIDHHSAIKEETFLKLGWCMHLAPTLDSAIEFARWWAGDRTSRH